jgi:hypothetical protein
MSYVSGTINDFESRLHELATTTGILNTFMLEGSGYLASATAQQSGKWEREARMCDFRITNNAAKLTTQHMGVYVSTGAASAPNAPSSLNVSILNSPDPILTWTDNGGAPTGFAIEVSINGNSYNQIATVASGTTTYTDTVTNFPLSEIEYDYQVRALNAGGYSSYCTPTGFNTPDAPTAPGSFIASDTAGGWPVRMTWDGAGGFEFWDYVTIYRDDNQGAGPQQLVQLNSATTNYNDDGENPVESPNTYTYTIKAHTTFYGYGEGPAASADATI